MYGNEGNFDLYIYDLLKEAGITAQYQATDIHELQQALAAASKHQTGEQGRPDYIAVVEGYVLVIEDKRDQDKLCLRDNGGALFYARKIIEGSTYKKVFAFGNAGDAKHHTLKPLFVSPDDVKELDTVETFENFSARNIEKFYRYAVMGETPPEELQHDEIMTKTKELHEQFRNYGGLSDREKPLVVSAILLALQEKKYGFSLDSLTGDDTNTDGEKLYTQLEKSLKRAKVAPEVKLNQVLKQFEFINTRPVLSEHNEKLKKSPLKSFAEYINNEIYSAIELNSTPKDYLGMFYGEFVRYSGGDGQTLGVVVTPPHITELFCDLVNLQHDDVIFDPCCGTGGFLVAGMHRMLNAAKTDTQRKHIKEKQIYGIELRDDMFSIATTNMILRGDGQSNLTCGDFFKTDASELQLKQITVGFMNPPYSQAKKRNDAELSELAFTEHLLESVLPGGRVAVIVPVSTMIGKTKEDRQRKAGILKHHTLEGVISLNKNTFYGVGTVPCIAVFTAGEPHPKDKLAKFINFEDDGWVVKMHVGLVETERAKDRRHYLLDCWNGTRSDFPSAFMVETTVEASDEWLHSFYYYNDETPEEKNFVESIADYLTFEANMIFHGRGYLFGVGGGDEHT